MKKFLFGLTMAGLLLAACGNDEAQKESATDNEEQGIEVDKGLLDVELTLPAEFFDGQTPEEIEVSAKEQGVKEVKINEDGSVYYKMGKSDHKKMMNELETSIKESMVELVTSGEAASFKDIEYNKDFTEFDVTVDREAYENSMDAFMIFTFALSGSFYNAFDGENKDEIKITVNMIDAKTNEVFDTTVFPDDMEDTEETDAE